MRKLSFILIGVFILGAFVIVNKSNVVDAQIVKMEDRHKYQCDLFYMDYEVEGDDNLVNKTENVYSGDRSMNSIFVHPSNQSDTKAKFNIDLSEVKKDSLILFKFSTGFVMGANPDGVKFMVEVNDEKIFEHSQKVVKYIDHVLDLSQYAGQKIKLGLVTRPDPTCNYAWAVFGNPVVTAYTSNIFKSTDKLEFKANEVNKKICIDLDSSCKPEGFVVIEGEFIEKPQFSIEGNKENNYITLINKNKYAVFINGSQPIGSKDKAHIVVNIKSNSDCVINSLNYYVKDSIVNVSVFNHNKHTLFDNISFKINVELLNNGLGAVNKLDDLSYIVKYKDNNKNVITVEEFNIDGLNSGEKVNKQINLNGCIKKGDYKFILFEKQNNEEREISSFNATVHKGYIDGSKDLDFIKSDNLKIVLYKENNLVKEGHVYDISKGNNDLLGTICFGRFISENSNINLKDFNFQIISKNKIKLTKQLDEGIIENVWEIKDNKINMTHTFESTKDIDLFAFDGPIFLAGENSFGGTKDSAIFSGIDYLDDESSNNTLAISPPFHERWAPHPNKITIPVVSIEKNNKVINYSWNHLDNWCEDCNRCGVYFQSPAFDYKDYSAVGIFAPSIPNYTEENSIVAKEPYTMSSKQKIKLEAQIKVLDGESAYEGVYDYVKNNELPKPDKANIDFLTALRTTFEGLDKDKLPPNGWINFLGNENVPTINYEVIHTLIVSSLLLDEENKSKAIDIINSMNLDYGRFDWSYQDSCWFRLPKDCMDTYYNNVINRCNGYVQSQQDDGSWIYYAKDGDIFGKTGDKTMGTIAVPLIYLAKGYRITQNDKYLAAMDKGFKALNKMTKPAGAGPWELPNTNPDFFAGILGMISCIQGYEGTNNQEYLDIAVKIAKMSLPFIYLLDYSDYDDNDSLYTSIASYGATNWRFPWQGRPVQWQGATFARWLKVLAKYDKSLEWGYIAKGIDNASINMIKKTGELIGRFPDYINLYSEEETVYNIWPNLALASLELDINYNVSIDQKCEKDINVVSGASIDNISKADNEYKISLLGNKDGYIYTLIKTDKELSNFYYDEHKINMCENNLDDLDFGYRKGNNFKGYIVKVKCINDNFNIRFNIH